MWNKPNQRLETEDSQRSSINKFLWSPLHRPVRPLPRHSFRSRCAHRPKKRPLRPLELSLPESFPRSLLVSSHRGQWVEDLLLRFPRDHRRSSKGPELSRRSLSPQRPRSNGNSRPLRFLRSTPLSHRPSSWFPPDRTRGRRWRGSRATHPVERHSPRRCIKRRKSGNITVT